VDDRGAFGNGGPQQDTEIITLNILPVNDRPTLTTPGPVTTDEDLLTAITGISTTDVDSGSSPVLASITANNGTLTLGSVAGIEFADGTSNGSSVLVFTGLISDIDLALASLQYQGNPDYFNSPTGTPSATPDVITIRINDQGATGPVPQETSGTIAVTVRAVNDAPSFDGGPNQALLEDAPAQTVTGWATNISRGPSNESSQGLSFTVTTSNDALFATRPAINTTTGNLTYTLLPNAFGSATVTVRLRDTGGTNFGGVDTSDEYTFLIDVTGVNDVPVFTRTVGSISVNEDAPLQTTAVINGVRPGPITPAVASEAGQNLTFNVESSNPSLFLTLPEINIAGNNGLLTFQPAENANGSAILTITLSDDGGTDNGGVDTSAPQLLTIFVNAQNDAPILTTPVATLAAVEDTLFNITEISLTDVDAGSSPLQVTLRATSGRLDLTTTEGLTNITGRNSSNLSFRGSQTSLNQALNGLSYIGNLNFNGLDQITVTVNDQGNTGAGGQRTSVGTVTIDVAAVNDPPTLTVSSTARNVDEDRTLTLTGITVSDVDAGANSVELSLTADNGTLRFINPAGGTTITGDNTSNVVIRGSTTAINTSLARLVYQGNLDYNGPDAVNLTINDLGEFGSGGPGTAQGSLSINVRPVNDRPVITVPSAQTIVEDGEIQFTGATAVTITDVDAGVAPIRVTFTVTRGTVNFGSTEGLTVAGVGTRTATLTGPQAAIAAALETFSYRPDANYFGSDTLTISANDQGNTGGAAQTDTRTVSIFVQSENDVPVLVSNNGLLVSEGAPAQTIRNGALRTTDADNPPANTLVYSLVQATSPGTLRNGATVLATGSTFTQADIDNNLISYLQGGSESTGDSFVFTVIDGQGGVIGDTTFNITVNPINDRPTLVVNSPLTVLENNTNGSGDVITNTFLRVTDPDNTDAELRYTLRGLPSSGSIRLSGSTVPLNGTFTQADINSGRVRYRHDGSETTTDSFLFEVSDGAGGTISSTPFRIQITPQNDSPVVVSTGPITLNEGAAATIRNTALRTTDPDNLDSSIRYTLLSTPAFGTLSLGATVLAINSTFTQEQINNGQLSYSHDGSEEQPPGSEFGSDFFSFSVTDGTVTLPTRIFNIRVRPVNDAPEAVLNDGLVIDGTVPSITEINSSQLFVTDRDNAPSEIRYTLRSIPNAAVGTLRLGGETGTALGVGSSFTQDDLNNNRLVFEYLGGGTVTESFQFSVSDGSTTLSDDFFYISFN
jgi:VCBS repeat-containing protein